MKNLRKDIFYVSLTRILYSFFFGRCCRLQRVLFFSWSDCFFYVRSHACLSGFSGDFIVSNKLRCFFTAVYLFQITLILKKLLLIS